MKILDIWIFFLALNNSAYSLEEPSEGLLRKAASSIEFYSILLAPASRWIGANDENVYLDTSNGKSTGLGGTIKHGCEVYFFPKKDVSFPILAKIMEEKRKPFQEEVNSDPGSQEYLKWRKINEFSLTQSDFKEFMDDAFEIEARQIIKIIKIKWLEAGAAPSFKVMEINDYKKFKFTVLGAASRFEGMDDVFYYLSTASPERVLLPGELPHRFEMIVKIKKNKNPQEDINEYLNSIKQEVEWGWYKNYPFYFIDPEFVKWRSEINLKGPYDPRGVYDGPMDRTKDTTTESRSH